MISIVHIGYPKTGTTWFQEVFFPNVKNVEFIQKKKINKVVINPSVFEFDSQVIKSTFLNSKKKLLLSSESLIGNINARWNKGLSMKENALRIKSVFDTPIIVIFIRKQPELIASAYSQYIKIGGTYNIGRYLSIVFSMEHLNFHSTISFYSDLFGKENVKVFLYEDFKKNPILFIENFANKFNLEFDKKNIDFNFKVNKKLHPLLLQFLKFSNKFSAQGNPFKNYYLHVPLIQRNLKKIIFWLNEQTIFNYSKNFPEKILKKHYNKINNYYINSNKNLINTFKLNIIKDFNYPLK